MKQRDTDITSSSLDDRLRPRHAGLLATAWSLLGGVALYVVAIRYPAEILAFYDWLPGIGPWLIAKAGIELETRGALALFVGGYTGTPFKLFAAQANTAGIGLIVFTLLAVVSRGSRFLLASLATTGLARLPGDTARRCFGCMLCCGRFSTPRIGGLCGNNRGQCLPSAYAPVP